MRTLAVLAAPLLLTAAAAASPSPIQVTGWARATVPAQTGSAAYLTIRNAGHSPDRLLALASPAAKAARIHSSSLAGGVMRMRPAGALVLRPGQTLRMQADGIHVMLMGLKAPLRVGQRLPLELKFQRAGLVRTSLPIRLDNGGGHHGR